MPQGFRQFPQARNHGFHFDLGVGFGTVPFADHRIFLDQPQRCQVQVFARRGLAALAEFELSMILPAALLGQV